MAAPAPKSLDPRAPQVIAEREEGGTEILDEVKSHLDEITRRALEAGQFRTALRAIEVKLRMLGLDRPPAAKGAGKERALGAQTQPEPRQPAPTPAPPKAPQRAEVRPPLAAPAALMPDLLASMAKAPAPLDAVRAMLEVELAASRRPKADVRRRAA